jgi:hypothetical protein
MQVLNHWAKVPAPVKNSWFVCLFIGETGVWTQGFMLAKPALYHLSHAPSPENHSYKQFT